MSIHVITQLCRLKPINIKMLQPLNPELWCNEWCSSLVLPPGTVFKQFFSQHWMSGCDCWGPDGRLDTKIGQFDLCHISMSYASFVIIWHYMSYDAYDIDIWHISIWPILVSKRPSGPQHSHPMIGFWLKYFFDMRKMKNVSEKISLYKFFKSFVFFDQTRGQICRDFRDS